MEMSVEAFLGFIAEQFVAEIKPVLDIKRITSNSDLLGKYTEAVLRKLMRRIVHPMNICNGSVLDYPMAVKLPQFDVIVWAPYPLPPVMEVEDFGLVPLSSMFGLLEVKRSNYSDVAKRFGDFFDAVGQYVVNITGYGDVLAMGVVCVLTETISPALKAQMEAGRVLAILDARDGSKPIVRAQDFYSLINFLARVAFKYRALSATGVPLIQFPQ
jgi:hypothetical protein